MIYLSLLLMQKGKSFLKLRFFISWRSSYRNKAIEKMRAQIYWFNSDAHSGWGGSDANTGIQKERWVYH